MVQELQKNSMWTTVPPTPLHPLYAGNSQPHKICRLPTEPNSLAMAPDHNVGISRVPSVPPPPPMIKLPIQTGKKNILVGSNTELVGKNQSPAEVEKWFISFRMDIN